MALERHIVFVDVKNNNLTYSRGYAIRNVDIEGGQMFDDNNILVQVDEDGYMTITDKESGDSVYISPEFLGEFSEAVKLAIETKDTEPS